MPRLTEPPEVIETNQIDLSQLTNHPGTPPRITCLGHSLPVINRIPPMLPILTEIIRRYASHNCRCAIGVQEELIRVRPHFGRIESYENRGIPKNPNPAIGSKRSQRSP